MKLFPIILLLECLTSLAYEPLLTNWNNAALGIYRGNNQQTTIKWIGDSWVYLGWISGDVATNLQGQFGNAGTGFTCSNPDAPYFYTNLFPTLVGGWNRLPTYIYCNDNTTPATVSWTTRFKSAYLFWQVQFNTTAFNSLNILTNGSSFCQIGDDNGVGDAILGVTNVTVGADQTNTLELSLVTGSNGYGWCYGSEFHFASPGILMDSLGRSGATANMWMSGGVAPSYDYWATNSPASIFLIMFGVNEVNGGTFAGNSMATNLQNMINTTRSLMPNSDIVLVSPADVAVTNAGFSLRDVDSLMLAMAPTNHCGYYSGYTNMPTYLVGQANGYYLNTLHLNQLGSYVFSTNLAAYLNPLLSPRTTIQNLNVSSLNFR